MQETLLRRVFHFLHPLFNYLLTTVNPKIHKKQSSNFKRIHSTSRGIQMNKFPFIIFNYILNETTVAEHTHGE
jgi:hypothetical protein